MKSALKFLHHYCINSNQRWYPLLAMYYLTYTCDFRCPYCSNGDGQPYHSLQGKAVSGDVALEILQCIRAKSEHLVLTGGEPLSHPDFDQVLTGLKQLRFKTLALNTNGYELDQHLPVIADAVSTLIVSLDTMDARKANAWFGQGDGVLERILSNLDLAAASVSKKCEIMISAVITPGNIQDIYQVYEYAQTKGFSIAVCPELQGTEPAPKLRQESAYQELFDFLIREKKQKRSIFGSVSYLEHMRDFKEFDCRPFALLTVNPEGDIFYPCLEIGHIAGNMLHNNNLHDLRIQAGNRFGESECKTCCYSACALGFSLALDRPWAAI